MRIAMVSEHASPLAALGGTTRVARTCTSPRSHRRSRRARRGGRRPHPPRRPDLPERVRLAPGVLAPSRRPRGRRDRCPRTSCSQHMPAFADELVRAWSTSMPDVVHAHFWMSGHAALLAARGSRARGPDLPRAGVVKRRYQGDKDTSPPERFAIERDIGRRADEIVATCTDEVFELLRLGASRHTLTVVPCGVDLELSPDGACDPRRAGLRRLLCVGRMVERKGIGNVIEALAGLPGTELVVAGGPPRSELLDPTRRPSVCSAWRRRPAWPPRRPARADRAQRAARVAALGRRRRLRAVVRAVRHRAPGGDGLRRPGRRPRRSAG